MVFNMRIGACFAANSYQIYRACFSLMRTGSFLRCLAASDRIYFLGLQKICLGRSSSARKEICGIPGQKICHNEHCASKAGHFIDNNRKVVSLIKSVARPMPGIRVSRYLLVVAANASVVYSEKS
jgi:hypothetical protein